MKVDHFVNFFSKGVRLKIFFGIRVRKKKFHYLVIETKETVLVETYVMVIDS